MATTEYQREIRLVNGSALYGPEINAWFLDSQFLSSDFWFRIRDLGLGSDFWFRIWDLDLGSDFWFRIWDLSLGSDLWFRIWDLGLGSEI